ncbi:MAG: hypothetical protein IPK82_19805 [Polyangiaceae bacterium]|nr:hypothetical protein [Polyangiaceae bacterium]
MNRRTALGCVAGLMVTAVGTPAGAIDINVKVTGISDAIESLRALAGELQTLLNGVSYELRTTVSAALTDVRGLLDGLERLVRDSVHTVTNAFTVAVSDVLTQGLLLVEKLKRGIFEAIEEAARVLRQTIQAALVQVSAMVEDTLHQAENVGGRTIVRIANASHTAMIGGIGGAVAIGGLIGLVSIVRRPKKEPTAAKPVGATLTFVTLLAGGIALATFSPRVAKTFGASVELPDGHALCTETAKKGTALRGMLAEPARVARVLQTGLPKEVPFFVSAKEVIGCDPARRVKPVEGKNFFPPVMGSPQEEGAAALLEAPAGARMSSATSVFLTVPQGYPIKPVVYPSRAAREEGAFSQRAGEDGVAATGVESSDALRAHQAMFNAGATAYSRACAAFQKEPNGESFRALVRGGLKRGFGGPSIASKGKGSTHSNRSAEMETVAQEVKEVAAQCIVYAPSREEANVGREHYAIASDFLGDPIRCAADRECPNDKLCRTSTGECLAKGFYCRSPNDCKPGGECDLNHEECVARDTFACSRNEQCRPGEACFSETRKCVDIEAYAGLPCTITDSVRYKGLCYSTPGVWTAMGGGLECKPSYQPAADTSCDGADNDCDGVVDEEYKPGEMCTSTDPAVKGECIRGTKECVAGRERCRPIAAESEKCDDGKDNDCDGATDEGCQKPVPRH